jgi:hypothetical protein
MTVIANILMREADRLVAPKSLRSKLLHLPHDIIPASGPLGVTKTKSFLLAAYGKRNNTLLTDCVTVNHLSLCHW